jgi:uncharacterized protein YdiU (UPF0061 family)
LCDNVEEGIALAENAFGAFRDEYDAVWTSGMRGKLGLPAHVDAAVVASLVDELLPLLQESKADYTTFFRSLRHLRQAEPPAGFDDWLSRWRALGPDAESMDRANPIYIPRNHLVEEALTAAAAGDLDPLERLLVAVTDPYHERPGLERYASPAPEDFGPYRTFCGT